MTEERKECEDVFLCVIKVIQKLPSCKTEKLKADWFSNVNDSEEI